MRLFVAIEFDESTRKNLSRVASDPPLQGRGVRWVKEPLLHLTLKFLGEVIAEAVPAIQEALAGAARLSSTFPLAIRGLGCFPTARRPRVLWAGIATNRALEELFAGVEEALVPAGFPKESRPFSAHVTLARIQGAVRWTRELSPDSPSFGEVVLRELTLMRSQLSPQGPRYDAVGRSPLGSQSPGSL